MDLSRVFVDVDIQRDFCDETGALYVKGSPNDRFRALTRHAVQHHIPILGSVDSHAWDAWEFASSERQGPNGERPLFPNHCVKGTPGWLKVDGTLPPRFRFIPNVPFDAGKGGAPWLDSIVREIQSGETNGVYFEKEVYSLFANPLAERFLEELVTLAGTQLRFFVYGVATDYCVKAAALGLAQRGYKTTLLTDAIAGITPEGTEAAVREMTAAGVELATAELLLGGKAAS
jgi:nicotinamidase/pyrazinamidase